jgi:hypothetical protein
MAVKFKCLNLFYFRSVVRIDQYAFAYTGLLSGYSGLLTVTVPTSVTFLGQVVVQ